MTPWRIARRPLEAHAGVDVLLRERRDRAVGVELELHEDEVPELEVPLARAARRALRSPAAERLAAVVEELGVGPARPGAADRPEVVGAVEADDALGRHPDLLPEPHRLFVLAEPELRVAREDRHPEEIGVDLHVVEDELPGEVDRAVFEVLTEREVAEHLEEREVEAVEADLVDVRGSEDLLRRCQERRRWRLRVPGSTASAAACRRCSGASSGPRRAGRASRTDAACGPSTRRYERNPSRSSAVVRMRLIVRVALPARSRPPRVRFSSVRSRRGGGRANLL